MADAATASANTTDQSNIDIAYGAYQRGLYITAFNEATKRAQQNDAAAMVLLGEMYAQGLGVGRDDAKAAQWYKAAAEKGNRDALFALAMFSFQGREAAQAIKQRRRDFSKLPPSSAMPEPLITSVCFISRVSSFRRISGAPANCSQPPRKPAIPKHSMRSRQCTRKVVE